MRTILLQRHTFLLSATLLVFFCLLPISVDAATIKPTVKSPLEIYGWIPYWRSATGTQDAAAHISSFKGISPFGFTLKSDGTLYDAAGITEEPWVSFIADAKKNKVRVIPTVMNGNGEFMHAILSDTKKRIALEDEITNMVKERGYDGIDIDFEGKLAETKPYFATFLKGLYQRMGNKWVYCTIEARTPLSSRYDTIPKDIQYANDFAAINKYCDRVTIMAYDQGTIDLRLNEVQTGPYIPVADTKWVEKVVNEAAKTIAKKKIMIGVATYGYEYQVTPLSISGYRYDRLWAFNPRYATQIAASFGLTPQRNSAGELSFMYMPTSTLPMMPTSTEAGGPSNNSVSATTSFTDGSSGTTAVTAMPMHIMWWSDAQAIADKVALARKLGVRGVSVFKIDGGEDPGMWDVLK